MKVHSISIDQGSLLYVEDFVDQPKQVLEMLTNELSWKQGSIKMFGRRILEPRLTALYADSGVEYTYSHKTMTAEPWHQTLLDIKQSLENFFEHKFNSVLCNLYRNGNDSMGWHSDDEKELGPNPTIASISIGAERKFQLKHKSKPLKTEILLNSGSLLIMSGVLQHHWVHQIPKSKLINDPRINLTFRLIK